MTEPTGELDRLIRDALRQDDKDLMDRFGEQSTGEFVTEPFRSRRRLIAFGGVAANLLFLVAAIVSASRFLQAGDQRSMLIWGGAVAFCWGSVMAVKVWYWLEMMRLSLARDIKRVELQVALLSQERGQPSG